MPFSGTLRYLTLVRNDDSKENNSSIFNVTRIGELRTLTATSNRRTLPRITYILVTLIIEAIHSSEKSVLKYLHGTTFQKTAVFVVTAVKASNLTFFHFLPELVVFTLKYIYNVHLSRTSQLFFNVYSMCKILTFTSPLLFSNNSVVINNKKYNSAHRDLRK
jgi:hypothetical protein